MESNHIRRVLGVGIVAVVAVSLVALAYSEFSSAPRHAGNARPTQRGQDLASMTSLSAPPTETGWTYLGPDGAPSAASSLAADRTNSSRIYALSAMGTVFATTNGGASWEAAGQLPLGGGRLELSVTSADTLYAYANSDRDSTYPPSGVHRSTDRGRTWSLIVPGPGSAIGASGLQHIEQLRTIPGQPGVLLAASRVHGILRSTDDGQTWSAVASAGPPASTDCTALELAPDRNRFFAVCGAQVVTSPLDAPQLSPGSLPGLADASDRMKLAVAPSNGDVIYLATTKASQGHSRLITRIYRSIDGGVSWQIRFQRAVAGEASPPANSDNPFNIALPGIFGRDCLNPAPYNYFEDYRLSVDPRDTEMVWIGGAQLYRSDDGAATFGLASENVDIANAAIVFAAGYGEGANNTVLTAGQAGIQRTDWARDELQRYPASTCEQPGAGPAMLWNEMLTGFSAATVFDGSTRNTSEYAATIYSPSLYHGATIVGDDSSPWAWRSIMPMNWGMLYGRQADRVVFASGGNWVVRATPSPDLSPAWGWTYANPGNPHFGVIRFPSLRTSGVFQSRSGYALAQHPTIFPILAAGTAGGAMRSSNGGYSWQAIGPSLPMQAVGFRRDGALVGVTTEGRVVSEAVAGSGQWEQRDLNGCVISAGSSCSPVRAYMDYLVRDPVPDSLGMFGAGNQRDKPKVYYSPDGRTWEALDRPGQAGGLPSYFGMTSIAVHPDNPSVIYAGTPAGLFVTTNRGQSWQAASPPFSGVPVMKVSIERDALGNVRLFAFTFGRGIWARWLPQVTDFVDVPTYHWAHSYISRLFTAGVTTGCATDPRRYCPEQTVTRDQMAVFLVRAKNGAGYAPAAAVGVFADVPASHWAAPWIEQLARDGTTTGCAVGPLRYCPDHILTRDQMAVLVLRAKHGSGYQPPPATGTFDDVPAGHWAAAWIEQFAREGITGGCSVTPRLYCPDVAVTRDQMAVFLVRGFGLP